MTTKAPVAIDPRLHDAVVFDLDVVADTTRSQALIGLVRRLTASGIKTATDAAGGDLLETIAKLGSVIERTVLIHDVRGSAPAVRAGSFALVVGVDSAGVDLPPNASDSDVIVTDLADVEVSTGYLRRSLLPNALDTCSHLMGVLSARRPLICLDFDGTLSEIVTDPDAATLVDGAASALRDLAALTPVAVISGRDLADLRNRVDVPGIWYSGSHGLELVGPDGGFHEFGAAAPAIPALKAAATELNEILGEIPGVQVEPKRYAVSVHYRNVAPDQIDRVVEIAYRQGRSHNLQVSSGRKLVELRPDLDWDKGTALGWIRKHIERSEPTVPVYIGDDTTDEDGFGAVRFSGIGIAVRHLEDGDRPTAARFSVGGPTEVVELLRRIGQWLKDDNESADESADGAWTYTFHGYEPHSEKLREALCTVGNGYFATRGAAPESRAGQVHYPGTYLAGVYNRLDDLVGGAGIANESLVNLPNWLPLTFRVNGGDWFDVDTVELLSYRQTLDLRRAVLTRQLRFRDAAGHTTAVTQHRFVAMHTAHVAALQTVIVAEDWSGTIQVRSMLDGNVRNSLVERYRELASNHLRSLRKYGLSENSVLLAVETTQSHIRVALAARTTAWRDADPAPATYRLVDEEFAIGHDMFAELSAGEQLTVEKIVTVVTGRDVATSEPATAAERRLGRQQRFADLLHAHTVAWAHLWKRLSIEIDGHGDELRILRLHLLHLLQTVSNNSTDLDAGVPARGLHGEAYRGHIFWDELFIFPVLNLRLPSVTRSLLRYRYRRLPEARRAAVLAGYRGAMFPWQSGSDGREESPQLHVNPRSGRWNPDPSHLAHHIGIAIAYNVWQYYQVTGDLAYLIDYGTELLVEIARFWVSRTTYDAESRRYSIRGVIGPDEFHSGYPDRPHEGVDNNAYTNVMAVWVILRAIDALEVVPLPNRLDLREKLGITTGELERWTHVSRRMFVPFHDGVISQFEGYDQLKELDWAGYRQRYGNIQRLDRILEAEHDDVNRYKAAKQADALMLLFLLSSDELRGLLSRLGYQFAPEQIPKMVDYYLARTSHGSTLSAVVHTWVLARGHRDHAMDFFQQVLKSDVADIQGGTTSEGVHLAAMAGSIDVMQRCFTGIETRDGRLVLSPFWPETLGTLGFPIHYRGHHIYLRVSGRGAEITVDPRPAPPILVECRGQVEELASGSTIRIPDTARASEAP